MRKRTLWAALASAILLFTSCNHKSNDEVKNVIFIIGDGMGLNQACTIPNDSTNNFLRAHFTGFSKTYSANHKVTDSAAGGTALSCGIKTKNGMLGMTPDSISVKSILEDARDLGYATGIVVSCKIDHATPAAFYAHQPNRNMSKKIVNDFYNSNIDVIAGGGQNLIPNKDTLKSLGYQYVTNVDEMSNIKEGKVCALLSDDAMPVAQLRGDTIPMAVKEALRLLSQKQNGFFMMIEGSQIDWACHGNDAQYLRAEMDDLNTVIGICMDFADKNPGTLIVITADHETGGLSLVDEEKIPQFSSSNHTGVNVPVYSYGSSAKEFSGIMENYDIAHKIIDLLHVNK